MAENEDLDASGVSDPPVSGAGRAGSAAEQAEQVTLDSVLSELGGDEGLDVLLKVYRRDPKTRKTEWFENYYLSDMPLEPTLRRDCPEGGEFFVHVYARNPNGSKSRRQVVPMPIRERPAAAAAAPSLDIMQLLDKMQQNTLAAVTAIGEKFGDAVAKLSPAATPSAGGGLDLERIFGLMATARELFSSGNNAGGSSLLQQIKEIAAVKQLLLQESDSGGSGSGSALLRGIEMLSEIALRAPKSGGGAPAGENRAASEGNAMSLFLNKLRGQLAQLCVKAAAGKDAAVYAAVVLEEVPQSYYPQLLEWIGASNEVGMANLAKVCPDVLQHRGWFEQLLTELRDSFEVEELTDGDAGDQNASHATAPQTAGAGDANQDDT